MVEVVSNTPLREQRFVNAYEMAGYYTAHMLHRLATDARAPVQVALLGTKPETMQNMEVLLAATPGYKGLRDLLQANAAHATGSVSVTPNSRNARSCTALLVEVVDFIDQVSVDIVLPCHFRPLRRQVIKGEAVIVDITGVHLVDRELTKLGVMLDFDHGWAMHDTQLVDSV